MTHRGGGVCCTHNTCMPIGGKNTDIYANQEKKMQAYIQRNAEKSKNPSKVYNSNLLHQRFLKWYQVIHNSNPNYFYILNL